MNDTGGTVERFKPATDELIVQLTAAANEYADGFDGGGDRTLWGLNLTSDGAVWVVMPGLRDHVAVEHGQGAAAYEGDDESVTIWHDECEHRPGRTTHLDHAHDEMSARRHGVALLSSSTWPTCSICGSLLVATWRNSWPQSEPTYHCPVVHEQAGQRP